MTYIRPLIDPNASTSARQLAGGWSRFDYVELLERGRTPEIVPARELSSEQEDLLCSKRPALHGVGMDAPAVMGILNVTPDSFSDGGDSFLATNAVSRALEMQSEGAAIIDIGGESTRPGALEVSVSEELARIMPVIAQLDEKSDVVISVDTRKSEVVGALSNHSTTRFFVNDVSAMRFDPHMAEAVARGKYPICLMHSVADPETMQNHAEYDDVLLDVFDHLKERIDVAVTAGINRDQIIVDPGIGFGKTLEHNLALLRGLSLFHSLGCPIMLGASRKRFIGTIANAPEAKDRLGGSVSVALHGVSQGVQILRVHDTLATKQAVDLHMAINGTFGHDS